MVNIDLNSGDWKETNKPMYYSQHKRSWYCKECDFLTQSPRTAGAHAEEHELPLPFSRTKIEVELVPVVQQQPQTPKSEPNYRTYSENRNYSHSQNNRVCNDITSPNYVPTTPFDKKIWEKYQARRLINQMRVTGEFTEEQIEEEERKLGLRPKEETPKNDDFSKTAAIISLQKRYFSEEDEDVQFHILHVMNLIEKGNDPSKIPLLLASIPRPKPDNSSTKLLMIMMAAFIIKKQRESSLF